MNDFKHEPYWINKKKLLPEEYEAYKNMGVPDFTQNWLEMFTPTIIQDLFMIMGSCSNNQQKAEYIEKEMSYYGFETRGLGTNIYVMSNPVYPGVVFKFALDDNGLADNFNDEVLQHRIPRYTRTLMRHPSGIVSVQERKVPITSTERMQTFRGEILSTLNKLSKEYLIIDLSPSMYLNYCVERDGSWGFLDASDLYPIEYIKDRIRCNKAIGWDEEKRKTKRCHGSLVYSDDYSMVICKECGSEYIPSEIRPNDKEKEANMANKLSDGMSYEEREAMRLEELDALVKKKGLQQEEPSPKREFGFVSAVDIASHEPQYIMPAEHVEEHEEVPQETPRNVDEAPRGPRIIRMGNAGDEDVIYPAIHEPSPEIAQTTSFQATDPPKVDPEPEEDDEEEDETESEEKIFCGSGDVELDEPLTYTFGVDGDGAPALFIDLNTDDFPSAWEGGGFSVYIGIKESRQYRQAMSAKNFGRFLHAPFQEMLEEFDIG